VNLELYGIGRRFAMSSPDDGTTMSLTTRYEAHWGDIWLKHRESIPALGELLGVPVSCFVDDVTRFF